MKNRWLYVGIFITFTLLIPFQSEVIFFKIPGIMWIAKYDLEAIIVVVTFIAMYSFFAALIAGTSDTRFKIGLFLAGFILNLLIFFLYFICDDSSSCYWGLLAICVIGGIISSLVYTAIVLIGLGISKLLQR